MNKNTIIGFVLIGAIMFGFSWYQSNEYEKQVAAQKEKQEQDRIEQLAKFAEDSLRRAQGLVETPEVKVVEEPVYRDTILAQSTLTDTAKVLTLSNSKVQLEFTTKGGQLYSAKLNDYKAYDKPDLYLFNRGGASTNLTFYAGTYIQTKDRVFEVVEHTDSLLVMHLPFRAGGYMQQKYWLPEDSYMLQNELSFVDVNAVPVEYDNITMDFAVTIPRLEKGYKNEKQYSKLDYYYPGESGPEEIAEGTDESESVKSRFGWFAFQQQFFSVIMRAKNEFVAGDFAVKYYAENDPSHNLMNCRAGKLQLNAQRDPETSVVTIPMEIYMGPNDYSTLKDYDQKYEKIIPLGSWIVNWFSRLVIIPCFDFLGKFISNYGIVILLMTILIKLLLFPLTIKSYKSTAKMQVIKPEIDKLNEKYPDQKDAMKKQQAMMELYQKAGISPMGGCLPMLLQMPILFAMFRFFPASIELRQQKFLWADDLSAYDSIWDFGVNIPLLGDHLSLFALLMALTMFLYSKMTSSQMASGPGMGGMKFMSLYLMPIMMFVICNNLSAALSYYYLLSNILTMVITWYIRKFVVTEEKVKAEMALRASQPRKKSKWQMRLEEAQKMQQQMQKNKK